MTSSGAGMVVVVGMIIGVNGLAALALLGRLLRPPGAGGRGAAPGGNMAMDPGGKPPAAPGIGCIRGIPKPGPFGGGIIPGGNIIGAAPAGII